MAEYTSVQRDKLQAAFAIAHQVSERFDTPARERKYFKQIAELIWEAHGEPGKPWKGAGEELRIKMGLAKTAAGTDPSTPLVQDQPNKKEDPPAETDMERDRR